MLVSKSVRELHSFIDRREASLDTPVKFYFSDGCKDTTIGRVFIWEISGMLPDFVLDKKGVGKIVEYINREYSPAVALKRLKRLQDFGFETATLSSLSLCYDDCKFDFGIDFEELNRELLKIKSDEERIKRADDVINECTDRWFNEVDRNNPLYRMGVSGARVSPPQVRSMIVAKGLLVNMVGEIGKFPVMESLSHGLSPINYFNTCGPARKGLAGNFFIVPATGYFTRQLVNCARELPIVEEDCGTDCCIEINLAHGEYRYTPEGELITPDQLKVLKESGNTKIKIRSPITCQSTKGGVCSKCAGLDPATLKPWKVGFGIGTASAQHISEPSTQLGLRGKHGSGSTTLKEFENNVSNLFPNLLKTMGGVGTQGMSTNMGSCKGVSEILKDHKGDVLSAAVAIVEQAKDIFASGGIDIASIHFEMIERGCTDQVIKDDGSIGLRSHGESGKLMLKKVSQVPVSHPSWLKSIGNSHVEQRLKKAVYNREVTYDTVSERIMMGRNIKGNK